MELRSLRYFLAVAREENITKAANALNITQPTLSRQIMDLEEEFGRPLIIRGKRRVTLTQDGMFLRKRAAEVLALADKTAAEMRETGAEIAGDVYLGTGETDAIRVLAEIACEIKQKYPGIRYRIFTGDGDAVQERLDKGLVDLGLIFGPVDQGKYNSVSLPFHESWGVLVPATCALAGQNTVSPRDLWDKPLLLSQTALDAGFLQAWLQRELSELDVYATYTTMLNAVKLIEGGFGYAMIIDGLFNLTGSPLRFLPCEPALEAGIAVSGRNTRCSPLRRRLCGTRSSNVFHRNRPPLISAAECL